ncbi:hypothetical protein E6O75_ATG01224 [Venturia nashicola]|uniref:Uncharacterized protein n=1 Tax=Venturia nashicola TaxID=86259 RepID=A0A4Z1PLH2_9PEZI|nr:hypothetical protein E6O75_ATG01224 [Venturia nashicola]
MGISDNKLDFQQFCWSPSPATHHSFAPCILIISYDTFLLVNDRLSTLSLLQVLKLLPNMPFFGSFPFRATFRSNKNTIRTLRTIKPRQIRLSFRPIRTHTPQTLLTIPQISPPNLSSTLPLPTQVLINSATPEIQDIIQISLGLFLLSNELNLLHQAI